MIDLINNWFVDLTLITSKMTGLMLWEFIKRAIPDVVGYTVLATAGLVMLGVMTGQGMQRPLGVLAAVLVVAISILTVG